VNKQTTVSEQWLGKHVPVETNMDAIDLLLEMGCFLCDPCQGVTKKRSRASMACNRDIFTFYLTMYYFIDLVCEIIGTVATCGLLCQPRVIVKMIVKQVECR
jgi:hypothetical protein